MSRLCFRLVLGLALSLTFAPERAVAADPIMKHAEENPPVWGKDLNQALADAEKDNRPVLIFGTADWCGECRDLQVGPLAQRDMWEALNTFKLVLLDVDAPGNAEALKRLGVEGVPFLKTMDYRGQVLGEIRLKALPRDNFAQAFLEQLLHGGGLGKDRDRTPTGKTPETNHPNKSL